jgi:predicted nucleic acid-binding protein
LIRKIATDVSYIIRNINPSRIIFALDDKSWRRNIKIDENDGYKAQRVKSTFINWDKVYAALNDFADIMQNKGMIVTKIKNAEADDLLCLWSHELQFIQNQHVIIVSGDEDLRQLVRFYPYDAPNHKFCFTTVYNPFMQGKNASKKLYVPKYFEEWLSTPSVCDMFNMKASIDVDKEDFKKIITAEKTKMEVVDGRMIALRKIFCGDDGDNVPAFYTWINAKGKEERITNSKFEKIYEKMILRPNELMDDEDLWERKEKLAEVIKEVIKQDIPFNIGDRLNRQVKLVVLSPFVFPEEIQNEFKDLKDKELEKPRVNFSNTNMHILLEGTKYVNTKKVENEANIFREIDKMSKNPLF